MVLQAFPTLKKKCWLDAGLLPISEDLSLQTAPSSGRCQMGCAGKSSPGCFLLPEDSFSHLMAHEGGPEAGAGS